jgi:predicted flap endonuclease-1-like 5' DNA nuclease
MGYPIKDIEGIGDVYKEKLNKIGITNTNQLLNRGKTPKGRKELEDSSGIGHKLILEWVNLSDLMRIKGVAEEYSDLLEEAGVDTVKELRNRKADNLYEKMKETNEAKNLVRRLPSPKSVANWVEQAKKLPPIVEY